MTNRTIKKRKYVPARVWQASNRPTDYFLETLEQRLDDDARSSYAMQLCNDFPKEIIVELLEAGISGWFDAGQSQEEAEREGRLPCSIELSAVNSALWRLGYRWSFSYDAADR